MDTQFTDHEFDEYAWRKGKWAYDNGWRYNGESFGAAYVGLYFGNDDNDSLLMLRRGSTPGRTLVLRRFSPQLTEIWSGQVETFQDFDQMMEYVLDYLKHSR